MPPLLLKTYHHLPYTARSLAASLHGRGLRRWRYGAHTERWAEAALSRDYWTPEQWRVYQGERLQFVLRRAATAVPYYRDYWQQRRRAGDRTSWAELSNWPILDKEQLRRQPEAFVAEDCNRRKMYHEHTSGTSGKPIDLWFQRETVQAWYALLEARCRRWYGVSRHDRWAILGGQLVTRVDSRKPPFWVWNAGLQQLYMSSYHLAPDLIPYYLDAMRQREVKYLLGYSSALHALAEGMLNRHVRPPRLAVVISNAEPLLQHQRDVISAAFQCPVRETYGMCEIVTAASECEAGELHAWPSAGILEVVQGHDPVRPGEVGDFVATGLLNADMPLIRYRVGDRGALHADSLARRPVTCTCGRSLPRISSIEGRSDDVLLTTDGRQIGRLDPVFKGDMRIREAQIIQETLSSFRVRYVPAPDFSAADGMKIADRLRSRIGDVEVVLEAVNEIPRTANGKFRAVVCRVPLAGRPARSLAEVEA